VSKGSAFLPGMTRLSPFALFSSQQLIIIAKPSPARQRERKKKLQQGRKTRS
jgi:hypothetical protein